MPESEPEAHALIVITTLPDESSARTLAAQLIEQRLAACINLLPASRALYRWHGAIEEATEIPLLIKTTTTRYEALEAAIRASHPYELPEIVAVPITTGLTAYLGWIASETTGDPTC